MIAKPNTKEISNFYANYVKLAKGKELISSLSRNMNSLKRIYKTIPAEKYDFAYAESKWTIKQMLRHIIDTERVFAYRALTMSRNDYTSLPGFEENYFADHANIADVTMEDLLKEFLLVRQSNILLFKGMTDTMLDYKGYVIVSKLNARCLGWMISGHTEHHLKVIIDKYL
jgi:DinB superfamily